MITKADTLQLVGTSPAIEAVREEIGYASKCDAKVLITGESGVGKEVVARLIHASSARRQHPLVTVNCAALTETLLETELFGHVRGSFTGAFRDHPGVLQQAHRGTVFMDEIGETSPRMQGLLLRFLETGEIQRVGSERVDAPVDVRVIAATNRNLMDGVSEKSFREDLYYRLNVIHLQLPPLRDRVQDIGEFLSGFLSLYAEQYGMSTPTVSPEALQGLLSYGWPGNVRELRNVAERLVVRNRNGVIDVRDLPVEILNSGVPRAIAGGPTAATVRSVVDELVAAMVVDRQSFWSVVYAPFMSRDLTRDDLRAIVRKGLEQTGGNYRTLVELFNMAEDDHKRFVNFLRKHHCHVAYQTFRSADARPPAVSALRSDAAERARPRWRPAAS
jgi:transcriptional regulator with PAS, ATPase and Fis domain